MKPWKERQARFVVRGIAGLGGADRYGRLHMVATSLRVMLGCSHIGT